MGTTSLAEVRATCIDALISLHTPKPQALGGIDSYIPRLDAWAETAAIIIFSVAVPLVLYIGLRNRKQTGKGIGLRFIQFTIIGISLPIVGILAIINVLPPEMVSGLMGGAIGYAVANQGATT